MAAAERVQDNQPAYVLHTRPWRETSLIVEAFAREAGRIALVARGARRPRSPVRGLLMAFQPLLLSWSGKGELRTLRHAEWQGGQLPLAGSSLMCGFYLNELLLRLLPRDDPHPALFTHYSDTLQALGRGEAQAPVLRRFEKRLLQELGYALVLEREAHTGAPIDPGTWYVYEPELGPVRRPPGEGDVQLRGRTLLALAREDFSDPATLGQAKQLMRMLIARHLGSDLLQTRQLLKDLQEL